MLECQRHLFSLPEDEHYLNCAQNGPLMKSVEEAGIAGIRRKSQPTSILAEHFLSEPEVVRHEFAELVNCSADQVALVPSVSYGVAIATHNLTLTPGQNVVLPGEEFPSDVYPWWELCSRFGAELRMVPRPTGAGNTAREWSQALVDAIDENTALVTLSIVHWTDGTLYDLKAIGERAREVGALYLLDGTQSVGALPFDFAQIKPDLLVCAAYKWLLGPYQTGVAVVGERLINGKPFEFNWVNRVESENFARLIDYRDGYQPGARRFDVGERSNWITIPMFVESMRQVKRWGVANIQAYCGELAHALETRLAELPGSESLRMAPAGERANHLFGVRLPEGTDLNQVAQALKERKVFVSIRGDSVRVAPNVYNTVENMHALAEGLISVGGTPTPR